MRFAKRCACAARAASPSSVGAAYSVSPMSAAAPTACSRSFRSAVVACTASSRSAASGSPDCKRHEHRRDAVAQLHALARRRAPTPGRRPSRRDRGGARRARRAGGRARHRRPRARRRSPCTRTPRAPPSPTSSGTRTSSIRRPAPDGSVDREARRDGLAADQGADRTARPWRGRRRRAARRRHAAPRQTSLGRVIRSRTVSSMSRAGSGAGAGRQRRASSTVGSGVKSSRTVAMSTPGDAVGERVVRLVDQADVLAAVDALDEPELPQRTVAVEHLPHEPLGQREQLPAAPGAGSVVRCTWRRCRSRRRRPRPGGRGRTARASPACGTGG